ncbi:hypothetical protein Tco_1516321 [Tanacetum coccineum]
MPTEMELTLEQTQQGVSYEVSVYPHGFEGYLKMVVELTNLKKDIALKFFKSTIQERMLKITMSNTSSRNKLNPEIKDHYNIFTRESQEYELKTKDEA